MEMRNINQCLGGLRMEDQGERSPQTWPTLWPTLWPTGGHIFKT